MQLRVIGVTTMCTDLACSLWTGQVNETFRKSILLFFADFVLQKPTCRYIVVLDPILKLIKE